MSSAVICDKCHKAMFTDSRSNKDAYAKLRIDYVDGLSALHLCKACYRQLCVEFIRDCTPEEWDDIFGNPEAGDEE